MVRRTGSAPRRLPGAGRRLVPFHSADRRRRRDARLERLEGDVGERGVGARAPAASLPRSSEHEPGPARSGARIRARRGSPADTGADTRSSRVPRRAQTRACASSASGQ
jgi:hypothetical protein